jgi:transposase
VQPVDRGRRPTAQRRTARTATIPKPADQIRNPAGRGSMGGRRPAFDAAAYTERNTVERAFNKLRAFRGVAMRTDRREYVYQGTVDVASIRIWLRSPVPTDPRDTP